MNTLDRPPVSAAGPANAQARPRQLVRRLLMAVGLFLAVFAVLYVGVLRPYHMRWGATDAEVLQALPGDPYIPAGVVVSTRAITIDAPAARVWPWVAQLGQGRGGFQSFDWLENLFAADIHNADRILPQYQTPRVGDHLSYMKDGPFEPVSLVIPGRDLVVGGWDWHLVPLGPDRTRLIVRYPSFPVRSWGAAALYYGIFEQAHLVMEIGMMLGIKRQAESAR